MQSVGLVGMWQAAYDASGIVHNQIDDTYYAVSDNSSLAQLAPLPHQEQDGVALYINGFPVQLSLVTTTPSPFGASSLSFNCETYKLQEISFWSMARQQYQIIDDMFGQLIPSNEPFLSIYLPGSFQVDAAGVDVPTLPLAKYIDNVGVENQASFDLDLGTASLDLQGCPSIGRCGPLVTPNLYTPPGVALTVCDTLPYPHDLFDDGQHRDGHARGRALRGLCLRQQQPADAFAGKKVGDLALVWVSQQQGDPQVIGYIEGAPPAPMANLTNKPSYAGATSVTFNAPISLSYRYVSNNDGSSTDKGSGKANADVTGTKSGQAPAPAVVSLPPVTNPLTGETDEGAETVVTLNNDNNPVRITLNDQNQIQSVSAPKSNGGSGNMHFSFEIGPVLAALGFGINSSSQTVKLDLEAGIGFSGGKTNGTTSQETSSEKLDEASSEGAMAPYTGDTFMANLNSLTVASTTAGTRHRRSPILPNPNLGGFTTSNPPGALPKTTLTEERSGSDVRAVALWPGLRHLADPRRLSADAAADQHRLRLRPRAGHPDPA